MNAVKALNVGIDKGSEKVCILLYADDVVFFVWEGKWSTKNVKDIKVLVL